MEKLFHGTTDSALPEILGSGQLLSFRGKKREKAYLALVGKIRLAKASQKPSEPEKQGVLARLKKAFQKKELPKPVEKTLEDKINESAEKIEAEYDNIGVVHFSDNLHYSAAYPPIGPDFKREPNSIVLEFKFSPRQLKESQTNEFSNMAIGWYSLHSFPSGLKLDNLVAIHATHENAQKVREILSKFEKYKKIKVIEPEPLSEFPYAPL